MGNRYVTRLVLILAAGSLFDARGRQTDSQSTAPSTAALWSSRTM